jgi:hypothetical protein
MSLDKIIEIGKRIKAINSSSKDLDSMTKPQIKTYGESIGVSLPGSLSKAKMIDKVNSDDAFLEAEEDRKRLEAREVCREMDGV